MRPMRHTGTEPLVIRAAHSRVVRPGDVVDFDERVFAGNGAGYSLEFALSDDVRHFAPHVDEATDPAGGGDADGSDADGTDGDGDGDDIVGLNAKQAAELIAATESEEQLTIYKAAEDARAGGPRVSVLRAIDTRLAALAAPPAEN